MDNLFELEGLEYNRIPKEYIISFHGKETDQYLIRWSIYAAMNENGEYSSYVYRELFYIQRQTPACFVIQSYTNGKDKFVLKDQNGRRFAYLTDELAINSLYKRVLWRKIYANNAYHTALYVEEVFNKCFDTINKKPKIGAEI